jgi:hypothetical protein
MTRLHLCMQVVALATKDGLLGMDCTMDESDPYKSDPYLKFLALPSSWNKVKRTFACTSAPPPPFLHPPSPPCPLAPLPPRPPPPPPPKHTHILRCEVVCIHTGCGGAACGGAQNRVDQQQLEPCAEAISGQHAQALQRRPRP